MNHQNDYPSCLSLIAADAVQGFHLKWLCHLEEELSGQALFLAVVGTNCPASLRGAERRSNPGFVFPVRGKP